ncbi:hypothetical protein [Streptomyces sp. GQFP]|uniref:hypothetical protein n=1 Tax=Streptomyces sp. GQFP TaxID=2907545 RepID=UPI001F3DD5A3|nr:hypothetical protein [Streptomyces sp. GQFP]UIX29663.1 hypothetical protein LUX31_06200 [Streptomyces sp. GQFP]
MRKAMTVAVSAGSEAGRRGSVLSVGSGMELVAARGRRVAALRSLVGASEWASGRVGSAA